MTRYSFIIVVFSAIALRFDTGVPKILLILEHVFCVIIFSFELFLHISYSHWYHNPGFYIFIIGTAVYLFPWIVLIKFPGSRWARSTPGFCAPAYTTIFWLSGVAFSADRLFTPILYSIWYYLFPSVVFAILHATHTKIAHVQSRKV